MKKFKVLKRIAMHVNILAELMALPDDSGDKGFRELMYQSVEEVFREEVKEIGGILRDDRLRKVFIKLVFSQFFDRVKLYTSEVSCTNCESFVDCKLIKMIEERRVLPAWHSELVETAMRCERYRPQEDLITGREFKSTAEHLFSILKDLGLELDERVKRNVRKFVEDSVSHFIEKTRERNKVVVN